MYTMFVLHLRRWKKRRPKIYIYYWKNPTLKESDREKKIEEKKRKKTAGSDPIR